ncbi:uncharacterized protein PV09_07163 [Verruconis gallopava]|uniref:Uncharacterized protein n=1 Tax=Verruconis gallopava TaxID=253628 RepID=A0A0D1XGR4_9PEZI|nr:uncharacterized protein PV09_07163 [Verruconis gallopava]KIW01396.1 hypothetical protein PV09_07163 [Verruconis gallopava]
MSRCARTCMQTGSLVFGQRNRRSGDGLPVALTSFQQAAGEGDTMRGYVSQTLFWQPERDSWSFDSPGMASECASMRMSQRMSGRGRTEGVSAWAEEGGSVSTTEGRKEQVRACGSGWPHERLAVRVTE